MTRRPVPISRKRDYVKKAERNRPRTKRRRLPEGGRGRTLPVFSLSLCAFAKGVGKCREEEGFLLLKEVQGDPEQRFWPDDSEMTSGERGEAMKTWRASRIYHGGVSGAAIRPGKNGHA